MQEFEVGDRVRIIDTSHSNAVPDMIPMVGESYKIDEIYDRNYYVINNYVWSGKDITRGAHTPTGKLADKSAKIFDINNLVDKND